MYSPIPTWGYMCVETVIHPCDIAVLHTENIGKEKQGIIMNHK